MRGLRVEKAAPFFLLVRIRVNPKDLQRFEKEMPSLRTSFSGAGFQLLLAGVCEDAYGPDQTVKEVLHVWLMPSADALLTGMSLLADDVAYSAIDRIIVDEIQDLGTQTRLYSQGIADLLGPWQAVRHRKSRTEHRITDRYLLVTHKVEAPKLAEYGAQYEEGLSAFNARTGWLLGEGLLHITGELNRISRAWVVPPGLTIEEAKKLLADGPGAACVTEAGTKLAFLRQTRYEDDFGPLGGAAATSR